MAEPMLQPRGKMIHDIVHNTVDVPTPGLGPVPEPVAPPTEPVPPPRTRTAIICRMRGCENPITDKFGFCGEHHRQLADDSRFCPCVIRPIGDEGVTGMYCALCGAQVWPLQRLDDGSRDYWPIDAESSIEGQCWVIDGGFRVIQSDKQRDALLSDGTLFRTHPSVCPRRPMFSERRPESYVTIPKEESDG